MAFDQPLAADAHQSVRPMTAQQAAAPQASIAAEPASEQQAADSGEESADEELDL